LTNKSTSYCLQWLDMLAGQWASETASSL